MKVIFISDETKKMYSHLNENDLKFIFENSELVQECDEKYFRDRLDFTVNKQPYLNVPKYIADLYGVDTKMLIFPDGNGVLYKTRAENPFEKKKTLITKRDTLKDILKSYPNSLPDELKRDIEKTIREYNQGIKRINRKIHEEGER